MKIDSAAALYCCINLDIFLLYCNYMDERFAYPRQKILETIEGISHEDRTAYPSHIYDPERIEIMRELALKEYFKLFPFFKEADFKNMDDAMIEWFDGRKSEMAPVHDYWNFLGGMLLSLKLKNIRSYVTSEHITWKLENLNPKTVDLYWAVGTLSDHGDVDQAYSYDFVKEKIIDQPEEYVKNVKISDQKSGDTIVDRDHYPIIALRHLDGNIELLDGNRRVMRAWLQNNEFMNAWVGTITNEPAIYNHWVGADFLILLISEYTQNPTATVFDSVRSQLEIVFATSSIAKYHYQKRCMHIKAAKELAEGLL